MHLNTVRNIIGIIGNVISFGLFISPVQVFYKIKQRKDVEEFSPNPYLATILNCAIWVFYGIVRPHSTLIWTINGIGLIIELIYISIYIFYANGSQRRYVMIMIALEAFFVAVVAGLTLRLAHTLSRRILVLGIIAVAFNIAMYAMPLDIVRKVIQTKSIEYMPVYLSFCSFVNGLVWVTFAQLVHFDLFLTISNGAGALFGVIQIIVIVVYYKSTPKRDDQQMPSTIPPPADFEGKTPV